MSHTAPKLNRLCALAGLCLFFMVGACSRSEHEDSRDASLRLSVLSPALAEIVRELGGADLIVGRHGYDTHSDPELPVIGDQSGIAYETLIGTDPTHVLMEPSAAGVPDRLIAFAEDDGWSLELLPTLSLDDIDASADAIATVLGEDAFDRLDAWRERRDRTLSPIPFGTRPSVLLLIGTDPPAALGPGSVHHDIAQRLGCLGLPDDGGAYQRLSLEDVIRLDPDCIVLLAPNAPIGQEVGELFGGLMRLDIEAVRAGRLLVVRDPMGLIPSTSLIRVTEDLRAQLLSTFELGAESSRD